MGKNGLSIAIVGKDVSQANAYLLVEKALLLAAISSQIEISIIYIDSHSVNENNVDELLNDVDAILVPGGFNSDGTEGMIMAINVVYCIFCHCQSIVNFLHYIFQYAENTA